MKHSGICSASTCLEVICVFIVLYEPPLLTGLVLLYLNSHMATFLCGRHSDYFSSLPDHHAEPLSTFFSSNLYSLSSQALGCRELSSRGQGAVHAGVSWRITGVSSGPDQR